jgi:hypothetical protein
VSSDEPQPRRPIRVRDTKAAGARRRAEDLAERQHPAHRAAQAVGLLRMITPAEASEYREPPDLYWTLVRLTQLTDLTGHLLDLANQWLREQHRDGMVVATPDGGDVAATIHALLEAAVAGRAFSAAIDDAAWHVGHVADRDASAD